MVNHFPDRPPELVIQYSRVAGVGKGLAAEDRFTEIPSNTWGGQAAEHYNKGMSAMLKWLFILATNMILSGFFGLGTALIHLLWLEFATVKFPKVHYTDNYQAAFALACAAVFFVTTLVRQIQTQLDTKLLPLREVGFVLVFIGIAMFCLTPVPGSNFLKYIYEISYSAKPKTSEQPAVPAKK